MNKTRKCRMCDKTKPEIKFFKINADIVKGTDTALINSLHDKMVCSSCYVGVTQKEPYLI